MTQSRCHQNPAEYRIRVKGLLDKKWNNWFKEMTITHEAEDTILIGPVVDQAALHGLLVRIRDLNLILISLERIEPKGGKK
ncbi:MAG: hypothetical protein JSV96_18790 [Candidatus Aminicenantes bacterium]|nr:MAG: hypothetical protein JSV96_18790 [Candidatus Aminicenantes bacterium]